jgi:hypothetical protein
MELMPYPLIDTPEALEAATAAAMQSRRERLLRIAVGNGAQTRMAYAGTAIVALCAVAAYFADGRFSAMILGLEAFMLVGFVFFGAKAARIKALRELQEMQPPS